MTWYTEHRQEWIAETLRVFGYINREHIERKFGVSTPQASYDLRDFQKRNPDLSAGMTLVEKVARAIYADHIDNAGKSWSELSGSQHNDYRGHARAAIEAMRGEPTDAMFRATGIYANGDLVGGAVSRENLAGIFNAMIDASLKEGE